MGSDNGHVSIGLERLLSERSPWSKAARIGLLMNQASVDRHYQYGWDLLHARFPQQVTVVFSPQHGLWGEQQANMIESPDSRLPKYGTPVLSLYGETRSLTPAMLDQFDILVVDLMDVGTRVYTYVWTVMNCLQACAAAEKPVVVLDRPNPLGGTVFEGAVLDLGFRSFVGQAAIPMRHGLTIGELAHFLNGAYDMGVELSVVELRGWKRDMLFPATGLPWVPPSPNMPHFETALLYPGQVLLEGTNLSEGRGTTRPFEMFGAPYLDPWQMAKHCSPDEFPGLILRPVRFRPTFDKWQNESCGGYFLHVAQPEEVRSYEMTVRILKEIRRLYADQFDWLPPPYEYEETKMPIDILSGDNRLRNWIDEPESDDLLGSRAPFHCDYEAWKRQIEPFLLYAP